MGLQYYLTQGAEMLKDVEVGVKFYKELGKLEKQLAKYQSKNTDKGFGYARF